MRERSLLEILWRGRWIVAAGAIFGIIIGLVYIRLTEPIFAAAARVIIRSETPGETRTTFSEPSGNFLGTQCEVIRSALVLQSALHTLGPDVPKDMSHAADPVALLQRRLSAEVGKHDQVVTIHYQGPGAEDSKQLLNAVVNSYGRWLSARDRTTMESLTRALAGEKAKYERKSADELEQIAAFRQNHLNLQSERATANSQRRSQLSSALAAAQLQVIDAKNEYDAARNPSLTPAALKQLMEIIPARPELNVIRGEMERLRVVLDDLQTRYQVVALTTGKDHPRLREIQLLIDQTRESSATQERRLLDTCLNATEQRLADSRKKEEDIQQMLDQESQQAFDADDPAAEWARLESAHQRTVAICETLETRLHDASMGKSNERIVLEILEPASVTTSPISPRKRQILPMALVAGFIAGGFLAFALNTLDKRLQSSDEILACLGIPVFGVIAMTPKGIAHTDGSRPEFSEACRSIRAGLRQAACGLPAQTILICSPEGKEGRTTVAVALAISMARAGRRVLLLDGDTAAPVLHKLLNLGNLAGVTDLASNSIMLGDAIHDTTHQLLKVIPAGGSGAGIKDLLENGYIPRLLEELCGQFDQIVIDSAPILQGSDASELAVLCDATILVLRAGVSKNTTTELAMEALLDRGVNVAGVVVNAAPPNRVGVSKPWHQRYGFARNVDNSPNGRGTASSREPANMHR